jgi:hypothetical protein
MGITKRTHSNPCFWTALWNKQYYENFVSGGETLSARKQKVFSLNVKANKIIETTVDNVHFDKLLGISEITHENAKNFCKKYFPQKFEQVSKEIEKNPETLYLDFESIWTKIEEKFGYKTLLKVIKNQKIENKEEKLDLTFFITIQNLRSHAIISSMIEFSEMIGEPKYEYYIQLKHMISNPDFLFSLVAPLLFSQWIIYVADEHTFPLPDTPILVNAQNIMIALSPRMLLEINLNEQASEYSWIQKVLSASKLEEYRKRCISNTFKEIIFDRKDVLEAWMYQSEFIRRVNIIAEQKSFNVMVKQEPDRELWKINAFGNLENDNRKRRRHRKTK